MDIKSKCEKYWMEEGVNDIWSGHYGDYSYMALISFYNNSILYVSSTHNSIVELTNDKLIFHSWHTCKIVDSIIDSWYYQEWENMFRTFDWDGSEDSVEEKAEEELKKILLENKNIIVKK
jgi:hypothetical protein